MICYKNAAGMIHSLLILKEGSHDSIENGGAYKDILISPFGQGVFFRAGPEKEIHNDCVCVLYCKTY